MKNIKIKVCNYDPNDTCSYGYYLVNLLKKHYEIEFSEDPDYLFYNEHESEHLDYSCIKIFYTGENIHPDFNFCDYALAFDYLEFGDRYMRFPIYHISTFYREKELRESAHFDISNLPAFTAEDLAQKTDFCSFVYSNYLADPHRKMFFDLLSDYKKVNSGGKYLNNIGGPTDDKLAFERGHKFSIAFENSSNDGYTTEKIFNAIAANTIPIYWGNPHISKEFNSKRFIDCTQYASLEEVVERVKEIDRNDELYLQIMNEPFLNHPDDLRNVEQKFEAFMRHIFDQPLEAARRVRINPARQKDMLDNHKALAKVIALKNKQREILSKIYQPLKKLKFVDRIKQRYLIHKNK